VISQTYFVWFKFLSIELCIMTQNTVFFMTLQKNVYLAAVEWKVLRCWLGQGNFLSTHPYTYLDHKPLIYSLPCSWDQRCMPWHLDYLLRWGLDNYSPPGLSLNYNPPNLHLLSSHGIQLFFIHSWRSLLCLHFFFFWWDWCLNSGLHTCKQSTLHLEPHLQSILLWLFWRQGLPELFDHSCPQLLILLTSAIILARIIGVNHQDLHTFRKCST
jgi:hypothetical protein